MSKSSGFSNTLSRLDRLNNPSRFEEIETLHRNAFAWQPQGRIPLGIHVVNPEHAKGLSYERWLEPEGYFAAQEKFLADTLEVGSDLLPVVAINHLGDAVLPSMLGSKMHMPETTSAMLQDVGPTPLAVLDSIEQVADMELPSMDAGIMPEIEKMLRYYRERLAEWVEVVGPLSTGPFSTAMEVRGSDLLLDVMAEPALSKKLIMLCAELQVKVHHRLYEVVGMDLKRWPTNFSIAGAGLRLGEDSICNLSSAMIKEFCQEAYRHIYEACGGEGQLHFCSLPHSRFEHIYTVLAEMVEISVASSQFGFEYYQDHLEELRGKLAVESFYGDAYGYVCEKYGSFKDWALEFVPKYKNESGLVLYMQVSSVEEGREVWATWQQAHDR